MSVYVHPANCAGDCCAYDAWTDDLATGEPHDVEYHPPSRRELQWSSSSQRATDARPARVALSGDPMQAPEAIEGGRDAWRSGAPSSTSVAVTLAATGQPHVGNATAGPSRAPLCHDTSSSGRAGAGSLQHVSRPAVRPDGS